MKSTEKWKLGILRFWPRVFLYCSDVTRVLVIPVKTETYMNDEDVSNVHTSQSTYRIFLTNTNQLMVFSGIIGVNSENHSNLMSCSFFLELYWCFGGTWYLLLHGRRLEWKCLIINFSWRCFQVLDLYVVIVYCILIKKTACFARTYTQTHACITFEGRNKDNLISNMYINQHDTQNSCD